MALGMYFSPKGMGKAQYDECIKQLEAAGAGAPAGRLYHICFEVGGNLRVFDVWESQAAFEQFGQTLVPILAGLGVDVGQPDVCPVHNIVKG